MYCATVIVSVTNATFSIFSGFAIFVMVRYIALNDGLTVEDVVTSVGFGLAFVTLAEAMQFFGSFDDIFSCHLFNDALYFRPGLQ